MTDKRTFWLSFANEERFGGVVIVDMQEDELKGFDEGSRIVPVTAKTIKLGINPGGEYDVLMYAVPPSRHIPEHYKHRILDHAEADKAQGNNSWLH